MEYSTIGKSLVYYSRPWMGGVWPHDYYLVAIVNSERIKIVWKVTQHIWLTDEEMDLTYWLEPSRSMMIGDVIVNRFGRFLCERTGWTEF